MFRVGDKVRVISDVISNKRNWKNCVGIVTDVDYSGGSETYIQVQVGKEWYEFLPFELEKTSGN